MHGIQISRQNFGCYFEISIFNIVASQKEKLLKKKIYLFRPKCSKKGKGSVRRHVLQEGCKNIGDRILSYKPYFKEEKQSRTKCSASAAEKRKNSLKWNQSNMLRWKHLGKKVFFYLPQCQVDETNAWDICSPKVPYKSVHFRDKECKKKNTFS